MIEQAMYHKPETEYGYARDSKTFCLRIRTAREDEPNIFVVYGGKYDFWGTQFRTEWRFPTGTDCIITTRWK